MPFGRFWRNQEGGRCLQGARLWGSRMGPRDLTLSVPSRTRPHPWLVSRQLSPSAPDRSAEVQARTMGRWQLLPPRCPEGVTTHQTPLFLDKQPSRPSLGSSRNPVVCYKLRCPDRSLPSVTAVTEPPSTGLQSAPDPRAWLGLVQQEQTARQVGGQHRPARDKWAH